MRQGQGQNALTGYLHNANICLDVYVCMNTYVCEREYLCVCVCMCLYSGNLSKAKDILYVCRTHCIGHVCKIYRLYIRLSLRYIWLSLSQFRIAKRLPKHIKTNIELQSNGIEYLLSDCNICGCQHLNDTRERLTMILITKLLILEFQLKNDYTLSIKLIQF